MKRLLPRRVHATGASIVLIFALVAGLALAAAASAEVRVGESTAPAYGISPETEIAKARASYDTTTGSVVFNVTTAAEPQAEDPLGNPNVVEMEVGLASTFGACTPSIFESLSGLPEVEIVSKYSGETAEFQFLESLSQTSPIEPAEKSVTGVTTSLSATSGYLVGQPFNCAVVLTASLEGLVATAFPISVPPVPPVPPAPPAPPAPAPNPAPQPAPATLSIGKAKSLKLKVGKPKRVKIEVKNTGGTGTAQGSLRVKSAKGVLVKPDVQKLPILAPGATFTLSVRVKLTEAAKKKSTLAVTGTASGVSGNGSIALKLES